MNLNFKIEEECGYFFGTINDVAYLNVTPHQIRFCNDQDNILELPLSGLLVNATPKEEILKTEHGIEFTKTIFSKDYEMEENLNKIVLKIKESTEVKTVIVVGSIIAAQAYPEQVMALIPCRGYERVAPAEKRMRLDKFTTFSNQ
ncbi:hypothetical protein U732_14 [Clostridium argentinense CDC 2741]|uniref:Uncharacterized protein n=2 Tax=Clostridium argentinense TaxID=29341 RepID=A0A0C1UCD8_9CLOT|nr:hypothetical protein [Clostridium argentinense]ARC83126.1 hypothetical protein RSJ17_00300 [Clostridium argentinense]KIE45210.1 hypothetical protein U732_14 [Clostridium argentinense CDC 2741]NFF41320.1 hypothetical protein [Clostridium argentinense]NFP51785.1 hypothetical protein [Clostridium argentinense]NFP74245.1 hypothetical protein [Clostridium argentinense]